MPEDSREVAPLAFTSDPLSRMFPPEWKDVWFRRKSQKANDDYYYECPCCRQRFSHEDIENLHGDHIWPFSLFGETSWENYRLICGSCNIRKSNFVDRNIRQALGQGEFRNLIIDFLRRSSALNPYSENSNLSDFLGVDSHPPVPILRKSLVTSQR